MNNNDIFSGVPALDDTQGVQDYLNQESIMQAGFGTTPQVSTNDNSQTPVDNTNQQNTNQNQDATQGSSPSVSDILTKLAEIESRLNQPKPTTPTQSQPQTQIQPQTRQSNRAGYTAQEQQFILNALNRGYSLEQIQEVLARRNSSNVQQAAINQRFANIENYLREREYKAAEGEFINRLTVFGDKWGLSEQDLVTFGNAALAKGINIATVTDLETVFRAVYPEQYAIRSKRMQNTNTSQIYGGTSISENSRVATSKMEDAYVDAFMRQAMPNSFKK